MGPQSAGPSSRSLALLALVGALTVLATVSGVPEVSVAPAPAPAPVGAHPDFVTLDEGGGRVRLATLGTRGPEVWPYTAASPSFARPASPINIVFDGPPRRVRRLFVRDERRDWNETANLTEGASLLDWRGLESAERYVFVRNGSGGQTAGAGAGTRTGEWREPVFQLHAGAYFGAQYHVRAYDVSAGRDRWTALQVHSEHWDWFSLTHRVDSVDDPRKRVETLLFTDPAVRSVRRQYLANGDSYDADGWTTVVHLSALALLASYAGARRPLSWLSRRTLRRGALFGGVAVVPLAVRTLGLLAWNAGLPPGVVSKALYPVLILGTPVVAVVAARGRSPEGAFSLAAGGFAVGVVLDYAWLSVSVLPASVLAHRALAAVAVGLVAAAGTGRTVRRTAVVGALLWAVAVALPLLP